MALTSWSAGGAPGRRTRPWSLPRIGAVCVHGRAGRWPSHRDRKRIPSTIAGSLPGNVRIFTGRQRQAARAAQSTASAALPRSRHGVSPGRRRAGGRLAAQTSSGGARPAAHGRHLPAVRPGANCGPVQRARADVRPGIWLGPEAQRRVRPTTIAGARRAQERSGKRNRTRGTDAGRQRGGPRIRRRAVSRRRRSGSRRVSRAPADRPTAARGAPAPPAAGRRDTQPARAAWRPEGQDPHPQPAHVHARGLPVCHRI